VKLERNEASGPLPLIHHPTSTPAHSLSDKMVLDYSKWDALELSDDSESLIMRSYFKVLIS
jgi:hypothetical protein